VAGGEIENLTALAERAVLDGREIEAQAAAGVPVVLLGIEDKFAGVRSAGGLKTPRLYWPCFRVHPITRATPG